MPYLSDEQDFGRPRSACRIRLEQLPKGEWTHFLHAEASRATVGRVASVVGKATGKVFHTRRTPTGTKVWRLS